jgi:hypothetical protein
MNELLLAYACLGAIFAPQAVQPLPGLTGPVSRKRVLILGMITGQEATKEKADALFYERESCLKTEKI